MHHHYHSEKSQIEKSDLLPLQNSINALFATFANIKASQDHLNDSFLAHFQLLQNHIQEQIPTTTPTPSTYTGDKKSVVPAPRQPPPKPLELGPLTGRNGSLPTAKLSVTRRLAPIPLRQLKAQAGVVVEETTIMEDANTVSTLDMQRNEDNNLLSKNPQLNSYFLCRLAPLAMHEPYFTELCFIGPYDPGPLDSPPPSKAYTSHDSSLLALVLYLETHSLTPSNLNTPLIPNCYPY